MPKKNTGTIETKNTASSTEPKVINDKIPRIISDNKEVVNLQNWELYKNDVNTISIFISYAHKDDKRLQEVIEFLGPFRRAGMFYDALIEVGELWREQIITAINNCKVGVLLLSPSFLDSEFINEVELAQLSELADSKNVSLLILFARECVHEFSNLSRFQFVNPKSKPLNGLSQSKRDHYYKILSNSILKKLKINILKP